MQNSCCKVLGSLSIWTLLLFGCPGTAVVLIPPEGDGGADATDRSELGPDAPSDGSTDLLAAQDASACANTCNGCCAEESCMGGGEDQACGTGGAICVDCTLTGQECSGSVCIGPCVPNCSNACNGGSDGCGGSCTVNTCTGCCDEQLVCRKGTANGLCGAGGEICDNCLATGLTCVDGDCTCVASCENACPGQDDGCGGTCPQNTCEGCCDEDNICVAGASSTACGEGGGACIDCTTTDLVCSSGQCVCMPDCQGKCAGTDDGCGNLCSKNHCSGCCDAALECLTGKIDTACGNNGTTCIDCTQQGQTCIGAHCAG